MPEVGDTVTATLTVDPFDVTTAAKLTVHAPDGTTAPEVDAVTDDDGHTWRRPVAYTLSGWWLLEWRVTGTGANPEYQRVFVSDIPTVGGPPVYADLEMLKLALAGRAPGSTALAMDSGRDKLLDAALAAASRSIDAYCGRRFWLDPAVVQRTINPRGRVAHTDEGEELLVDDIGSLAGLVVEVGSGTSFTAVTDYETTPDNALVKGDPVTGLLRVGGCWRYGLTTRVRITARWGWPSIPDVVAQATLLQATRLYRRKDSPEGVTGNAEWGLIRVSRIDPDVQALLAHLVTPAIG